MATDAIQVFVTTDTEEEAQSISQGLVQNGLAACVQVVGPISSTYRWEGEIAVSREWLCIIKSLAVRYADIEAAIKQLHSYEVPEILAVPVIAANEQYLQWLRAGVIPC